MFIFIQFLLRLSFGLALAMALTPPRLVTSGFYRNHAYVLLGLGALASLIAVARPETSHLAPPLVLAGASYAAAVCWLYENRRAGVAMLLAASGAAIVGAWLSMVRAPEAHLPAFEENRLAALFAVADPLASGWLLGTTIAAMFLGHWYLNTPTMQIGPLQRLLKLLGAAVVLRIAVCGVALALQLSDYSFAGSLNWALLAIRWFAGLLGTALLAQMAWQTLKIPNTQSATGILYIAVMFTFLGELAGLLLSASSNFPL